METRKLLKDGLYIGNATWLHDFAVTRNLSGLLPPARKVMRKFASWAVNNPLYYRPLDEILTDPQLPEADRLHLAALKKSHDYPVRWLLLGRVALLPRTLPRCSTGFRPRSRALTWRSSPANNCWRLPGSFTRIATNAPRRGNCWKSHSTSEASASLTCAA